MERELWLVKFKVCTLLKIYLFNFLVPGIELMSRVLQAGTCADELNPQSLFFFFFFKMSSHYLVRAGLELLALLFPQPPWY